MKFPSVKSVKTYADIVRADVAEKESVSTSSDAILQRYIATLEARIAVFEPATMGDLRVGRGFFAFNKNNCQSLRGKYDRSNLIKPNNIKINLLSICQNLVQQKSICFRL